LDEIIEEYGDLVDGEGIQLKADDEEVINLIHTTFENFLKWFDLEDIEVEQLNEMFKEIFSTKKW
jgi:hypothetical protein